MLALANALRTSVIGEAVHPIYAGTAPTPSRKGLRSNQRLHFPELHATVPNSLTRNNISRTLKGIKKSAHAEVPKRGNLSTGSEAAVRPVAFVRCTPDRGGPVATAQAGVLDLPPIKTQNW